MNLKPFWIIETDFIPLDETLVFTVDGTTRQCVDLVIHEDNAVETGEFLRIQLSGNITAGIPSTAIVTIKDSSRKWQWYEIGFEKRGRNLI